MKTILEMARKAGFDSAPNGRVYHPDTSDEHSLDKYLEAFAALVREDEREACAKVCEDSNTWDFYDPNGFAANLIRTRGQA